MLTSFREGRGKRERQTGEKERKSERRGGGETERETEGDSKGLITAYHLEYNLSHTNLQWDPHTVGV